MLKKEIIEELQKFDTLALAVSGGKDSMYLLNTFYQNRKELPNFFVVNINHNLRGEDSDLDSRLVLDYCKEREIECQYFNEDINKFCKDNGYGTEQGARIRRRQIFLQVISTTKAQRVVTAHHKDDQVESILMHIFRGSGIKGLTGMRFDDGMMLRPLLDITSEEIYSAMKENNWNYRDDKTNFDTDYSRNKLRHEIIPAIKEIYPGVISNVDRLGKIALKTQEFMDKSLEKGEIINGNLVFKTSILQKRNIMAVNSLLEGLDRIGWRVDFEEKHLNLIFSLVEKKVGARISLPWGIVAYREVDKVVLSKDTNIQFEEEKFSFPLDKDFGKWHITVSKEKMENALRCDLDKLEGAIIRQRKTGDSFTKFKGGKKSLGDFLTDKKIPLRERNDLVVFAKENEILVVPPIEISNQVAITENTKNVCYIKAIKNIGDNDGRDN